MSALKICPQCGTEYPANARFCEIDGTALRSAQGGTDLVGSIVADRYHIMKKLGEGGMGQVYLAEHVKMGRKSALKVMHPGMKADVDAISRFNREAANASRIAHSNVAAVYDFGETPDGIIYLAMEYVDGPPLTKIIEQNRALPPKRVAEIVRQTAEALAVAHDMGIVHRDLKPDNIMLAKNRDGSDCVKVVDFGIAKAAGNDAQKVTKTGLVVGTPEYMSPEQLAGDKLDGRSDIYSLGLVAFNMLTGTLPFPSDSAQEAMIMRLTDKPKPLAEMKPEVNWPPAVQAVMDKALERDMNARYQNAIDFGMALYNAIDRMPETQAMELGTQMMAAVPATRVAQAPAPAPSFGATVVVPIPPPVEAPVTQAAAPGSKKSNVGVLVGAAAVVVLVGGAVAFKMMSGGKTAGSPNTPGTATAVTPQGANEPTIQSPNQPTNALPANSTTLAKKTNAPPSSGAGKPVADQLRGLIDASNDPKRGSSVLSKVSSLMPQVKSSEELYLAAMLKGNVYATRGTPQDSMKACDEINAVADKLAPTERNQADRRKGLWCPSQ